MSPSLAVVVVVLIAAFGMAYVINRLIAVTIPSPTRQPRKESTETNPRPPKTSPAINKQVRIVETLAQPTIQRRSASQAGPVAQSTNRSGSPLLSATCRANV